MNYLDQNDSDQYDDYEAMFDPSSRYRKTRKTRKPKSLADKQQMRMEVDERASASKSELGFDTTYQPGHFEEGWLMESLQPFSDRGLITDVLARVKGGKEANVYRCAANPQTGFTLLAAKVYRPQMFRNLRNDKMYREGRQVLNGDGKIVKANDHRTMRAIGKKTAFGEQVAHTSWLMYEYNTLEQLHALGASVPKPLGHAENSLLMTYMGDEQIAAPTLSEVNLERDEVEPLFSETMRNIEVMLQHGMIHGDLSAYNILYWEGEITLIDFPQVTYSDTNSNAYDILRRDITRVCEYFADQGAPDDKAHDADAITRRLWKCYVELPPAMRAADLSRLLEKEEE